MADAIVKDKCGPKPGYRQSEDHVRARIAHRIQTLKEKGPPVTQGWLFAHYVLLGMDCVQLGGILRKDPKTIWAWMRRLGVPTRPRGGHNKKPEAAKRVVTKPTRLDEALVKAMYVDQGMSSAQIADALGSKSYTVCRALTRMGVPLRGMKGRSHTAEVREELRRRSIADGRVPYLKDGKHAMKGRSGSLHPLWKGGHTPERQAFYASEEWKEACKAVWHRANATCERCGKHHNTAESRGTFHVHHIVSFRVRELRAVVTNLALLCKTCHRYVHSRKNANREFIKEIPNAGR